MRVIQRPADLLGRRIAGYVLDEVLGSGGMGVIYRATSPFVHRRAAVKVLRSQFTEDEEVVGRFLKEAFVASAVDHPNVIPIWAADRFAEDDRIYILMPLIEGSSLEAICEQVGPLDLTTAATIALQIAAGLDAVHAIGVVHRDIKPANILISRKHGLQHFVTIVDFGVARLLAPLLGAEAMRRSQVGVVLGTEGIMAPEQARGEPTVDARADVYSWGAVLYLMATGRLPLPGGAGCELLPRPRALRPELPRAWEEVILAALDPDPAGRPASLREAARRIAAPLPRGSAMLARLVPDSTTPARSAKGRERPLYLEARWSGARGPVARRARALPIAIALASVAGLGLGIAGSQCTGDTSAATAAVPPGSLDVSATPWADVWIDGEAIGRAAGPRAVTAGTHRVRLVGPGSRSVELTLEVRPNETVPVRWSWER